MNQRRPSGEMIRGVVKALAVVVLLAVVEVVLRIGGWGLSPAEKTYSDIYDPQFEMIPGAPVPYLAVQDFLNGDGFRGRRLSPAKSEGVFRVISIGDSTTFGGFVENEQTYTFLLEKNLRAQGVNAEIMNAGIPGTTLWQQRMLVERRLLDYRPDLLIFYTSPSYRADFFVLHEAENGRVNIQKMQRGLARLRLYRILRRWLRPPKFEEVVNQYFEGHARPDGEIDAVTAMKQAREDLIRLRDIARKDRIGLLVAPVQVAAPFQAAQRKDIRPGDPKWPDLLVRFNETYLMMDVLRELEIPSCDPGGAFFEAYSREKLFLDDTHFTPAGHGLMSRVIEDCLRKNGLLPKKRN